MTVVVEQAHHSSNNSFSFTLETEFLQETGTGTGTDQLFQDVNLCSVKLRKVFFHYRQWKQTHGNKSVKCKHFFLM